MLGLAGVLLAVLVLTVPASAGARLVSKGPGSPPTVAPTSNADRPLYCLAHSCQTGNPSATNAIRAAQAPGPPSAQTFTQSAMAVLRGSQVSLHWATAAGDYFVLTSTAPDTLPNFGMTSAVTWPSGSGASWNSAQQWWTTTAGAVTVAIPPNAGAGATFMFQLYTCSATSGLCSNSPGGSGYSQVALSVATNWSAVSYKQDFHKLATLGQAGGSPLDVTFSASNTIWNSSEFSDAVGQSVRNSTLKSIPDPADVATSPFASCFSTPCGATGLSALGERVVYAGKLVWFTQGGWLGFPGGPVANHSEIVAYNPSTAGFCTYLVPGNDNEVIGLAVTGSGKTTKVWFLEADPVGGRPALDSFSPSQVGANCPNSYSLSGAGSFRQIAWPQNDFPSLIGVDPGGAALWVTDFFGNEIDRVDVATGTITPHTYTSANADSVHGAEPWQVVADANYVYAIDYGDSNLVRVNKTNGQVDQVRIPETSDTEEGYGLALAGSKLFFSLADDPQPSFGAASTIGYVDLSAWEAASAACPPGVDCAPAPTSGVVYTGLSSVADPSSDADFRGIAVSGRGSVALADLRQVVWLTP